MPGLHLAFQGYFTSMRLDNKQGTVILLSSVIRKHFETPFGCKEAQKIPYIHPFMVMVTVTSCSTTITNHLQPTLRISSQEPKTTEYNTASIINTLPTRLSLHTHLGAARKETTGRQWTTSLQTWFWELERARSWHGTKDSCHVLKLGGY